MLIQLPNAFGDAATNMAVDAALLETIPPGLALFRHYSWLEPAATFGYAQRHSDVQSTLEAVSETAPITRLIRRITGGGIVDHRNDWTYALILHRSLPCTGQPANQLYKQIHQAISHALTAMGIDNRFAPCPKNCPYPESPIPNPAPRNPLPESPIPYPASRIPEPASHCFRDPAADDVLRPDGRKIAGAAMKRSRHSLLVQGSVDRGALPENFNFAGFQRYFSEQIVQALQLETGALEDIRPLFDSRRIETERERFTSEAWNKRR